MPIAGQPGAPFFDQTHVTDFLDSLELLATSVGLNVDQLPRYVPYYSSQRVREFIRYAPEFSGTDWTAARHYLCKSYESEDIDLITPQDLENFVLHSKQQEMTSTRELSEYYVDFLRFSAQLRHFNLITDVQSRLAFFRGLSRSLQDYVVRKLPQDKYSQVDPPPVLEVKSILEAKFNPMSLESLIEQTEATDLSRSTKSDSKPSPAPSSPLPSTLPTTEQSMQPSRPHQIPAPRSRSIPYTRQPEDMPTTKNSPPRVPITPPSTSEPTKIKILSRPDLQRPAPTSRTPKTSVNEDSTSYARLELWEPPQAENKEPEEDIRVRDRLEPIEVEESLLDHILCPPEEPIDTLEDNSVREHDNPIVKRSNEIQQARLTAIILEDLRQGHPIFNAQYPDVPALRDLKLRAAKQFFDEQDKQKKLEERRCIPDHQQADVFELDWEWFCGFAKDEYLPSESNDSDTYCASETSECFAIEDLDSSTVSEDERSIDLNFTDVSEQEFEETSEPSKEQAPEPTIDIVPFTASERVKSECSSDFEESAAGCIEEPEPIDEYSLLSCHTDQSLQIHEPTKQEENRHFAPSPIPQTFTTSKRNDSSTEIVESKTTSVQKRAEQTIEPEPEPYIEQKISNFEPSASTDAADYFEPGLFDEPTSLPSGESRQEYVTSGSEPQVIAPEEIFETGYDPPVTETERAKLSEPPPSYVESMGIPAQRLRDKYRAHLMLIFVLLTVSGVALLLALQSTTKHAYQDQAASNLFELTTRISAIEWSAMAGFIGLIGTMVCTYICMRLTRFSPDKRAQIMVNRPRNYASLEKENLRINIAPQERIIKFLHRVVIFTRNEDDKQL
jgi:hypothetical protein